MRGPAASRTLQKLSSGHLIIIIIPPINRVTCSDTDGGNILRHGLRAPLSATPYWCNLSRYFCRSGSAAGHRFLPVWQMLGFRGLRHRADFSWPIIVASLSTEPQILSRSYYGGRAAAPFCRTGATSAAPPPGRLRVLRASARNIVSLVHAEPGGYDTTVHRAMNINSQLYWRPSCFSISPIRASRRASIAS